jgi:pyridoxine 4-dehydrogenase
MSTATRHDGTFSIGDLEVRRLGFGAMRITGPGVWGEPRDHEEAIRVLRRAVELGCNFIDTADSYGPDVSERLIAEALFPYPKELVIATKGGFVRPGPDRWTEDGRPAHLRAACEGSLRRLRVERIDLYQLHRIDPKVPADDQIGTLAALQAEGKIRYIGLSEVGVKEIEQARRRISVVTVQNRYSLTDRTHEQVVDYCQREGIGFIPWYPLGAGDLTKARGAIGRLVSKRGAIDRLASKRGATPSQLALMWLLWRSPVMLPIPGTSRVDHLEENVAAASMQVDDEEFRALDRAVR